MGDLKWYNSEEFRYDKFQAYYDFAHNFKLTNYKDACEMAFNTAWNHQSEINIKLKEENEKLKSEVERKVIDLNEQMSINEKLKKCVEFIAEVDPKQYQRRDDIVLSIAVNSYDTAKQTLKEIQ